jgi:hypothetical protein
MVFLGAHHAVRTAAGRLPDGPSSSPTVPAARAGRRSRRQVRTLARGVQAFEEAVESAVAVRTGAGHRCRTSGAHGRTAAPRAPDRRPPEQQGRGVVGDVAQQVSRCRNQSPSFGWASTSEERERITGAGSGDARVCSRERLSRSARVVSVGERTKRGGETGGVVRADVERCADVCAVVGEGPPTGRPGAVVRTAEAALHPWATPAGRGQPVLRGGQLLGRRWRPATGVLPGPDDQEDHGCPGAQHGGRVTSVLHALADPGRHQSGRDDRGGSHGHHPAAVQHRLPP